jgi:hypothetical protein
LNIFFHIIKDKMAQLKQIKGVPYFLKEGIVYTFELDHGLPSKQSVAIGTYQEASDSITFYDDWFQRVQPGLEAFRSRIEVIERDKLRESADKPQKQRKTPATQRKPAKAKGAKSD